MKRNLLVLVSLFVSLAAFAQWTKPEMPAGATLEFSDENDTTIYYLYNAEAEVFFSEGNAWGTQATWTTEGPGLKVFFTKYQATNAETGELDEWDGKTILFNDFTPTKNAWKYAFINSDTEIYMDRNKQENYFWECEQTDKGYRFFGGDLNPQFNHTNYPNCYMGVDKNMSTTIIYPLLDTSEAGIEGLVCVDWTLLPANSTYFDELKVYNAAVNLGEFIDSIKVDYPELKDDIAEAEAVYNNTSSTIEELNAAREALALAVNYASLKGATEENPINATGFIKNADFSSTKTEGWVITIEGATEIGYQKNTHTNTDVDPPVTISGFIQAWDASGKGLHDGAIYQILPSLPDGKYKFTVDACAVQEGTSNVVTGTELFALGGEAEMSQSISTGQYGGYKPHHYEVTFVSTGGDITLGVRTDSTNASWIACDNFTLTYYGPLGEDPIEKILLKDLIAKLNAKYGDIDELKACTDVKNAYLDALNAAEEATDNYTEYQKALEEAAAALDQSIKEYENFAAFIEEAEKRAEEFGEKYPDIANQLSDELMNWVDDYNYGNADSTYIANVRSLMDDIILNGIKKYMKAGDDVSILITNPKFEDGLKGWDHEEGFGLPERNGFTDPTHEYYFPVVARWQTTFDIYQDVAVPDGVYQLKMNGWFRPRQSTPTSISNYVENPEAENALCTGYFYMNDNKKKIRHIGSELFTEPIAAGRTDNVKDGETVVYYGPDHEQTASCLFKQGYYENEVYGVVTGGKLRIGAYSHEAAEAGFWTVVSNFRLIYHEKDAEVLKTVLGEYIEECEAYLANEENMFSTAERTAFSGLIDAAKASLEKTGEDMYNAYTALIEGKKVADANAAAYKDLIAGAEKLDGAIAQYDKTASATAKKTAQDLLDEIISGIEAGSFSTEEAIAKLSEIEAACNALVIPAEEPTDDNPADLTALIVNPSFEEGTTGWDLACEEYGNMQIQKNQSYPGDSPVMTNFAEIWSGSTTLGNGHIQQTIIGLPEGTYLVEADVMACDQNYDEEEAEEPYAVNGEYLFAQEDVTLLDRIALETQSGQPVHYGLYFKKQSADTPLTLGAMIEETNANWLAVDNFKLTYFGKNSNHEQTGIEELNANAKSNSIIFNLMGQKINTLQKGINIIGGKKVLVK